MLKFITGPTKSGKSQKLKSSVSEIPLRHMCFRWHLKDSESDFIPTSSPMKILRRVMDSRTTVVGIDDIHLFPEDIVNMCLALLAADKIVIIAGHLQDWRGFPYSHVNILSVLSDKMIKLCSKCYLCNQLASRHIEIDEDKTTRLEPMCTVCHMKVLGHNGIEYFGELIESSNEGLRKTDKVEPILKEEDIDGTAKHDAQTDEESRE